MSNVWPELLLLADMAIKAALHLEHWCTTAWLDLDSHIKKVEKYSANIMNIWIKLYTNPTGMKFNNSITLALDSHNSYGYVRQN